MPTSEGAGLLSIHLYPPGLELQEVLEIVGRPNSHLLNKSKASCLGIHMADFCKFYTPFSNMTIH